MPRMFERTSAMNNRQIFRGSNGDRTRDPKITRPNATTEL